MSLAAVSASTAIFWEVTPCSLVYMYQRRTQYSISRKRDTAATTTTWGKPAFPSGFPLANIISTGCANTRQAAGTSWKTSDPHTRLQNARYATPTAELLCPLLLTSQALYRFCKLPQKTSLKTCFLMQYIMQWITDNASGHYVAPNNHIKEHRSYATQNRQQPSWYQQSLSLHVNPLTPELNPSRATLSDEIFYWDFAYWTVHFVVGVKNQQMQQLFIQFINYVWYLLHVSALHWNPQGTFLVPSERCSIEEQSIECCV
jgi:hypothetical protein